MSVWGFVQSVTRNLDEAAGLNGAGTDSAPSSHADPLQDLRSAPITHHHAMDGEEERAEAEDDAVISREAVPEPRPHHGSSTPTEPISTPPDASSGGADENLPNVAVVSIPTTATNADAAHIAALSGQTERLSRALAKAEVDIARLTEELRQALSSKASNNVREEQLMEEGRQLAAEVGRERERVKALVAERRQSEAKIAQLQQLIEQGTLREQQAAEAKQLLLAERDRLKERMQEVQGETRKHATDTESTLRELEELRSRLVAMREEHHAALGSQKSAFDQAILARDTELDKARAEIDSLRLEIQTAVVQCEKRVASSERDLVAATQRALAAESRCLELTQQAAEAGADVRYDAERLQAQLSVAAAAKRQAEAKAITLEKELADVHIALRNVEASLAQKLAQQQEEIISLRRDVVSAQRAAEREKSRSNALLARNEELTEEANRLLASLQAESARGIQLRLAAASTSTPTSAQPTAAQTTAHSVLPGVQTEDEALAFIERLLNAHPAAANGTNGGAAATVGKVERALARVTVELKEAHRSTAAVKRELAELQAKHDVLLEMYGQQAEELAELTAASPAKSTVRVVP